MKKLTYKLNFKNNKHICIIVLLINFKNIILKGFSTTVKPNHIKTTNKMVITALMAALVMTSTFIKIQIPLGSSHTMIHLGNAFCILSGLLLGPVYGGLAAGIGSLLFDLLNPMFIMSAPTTLIFKFIMVFICGTISRQNKYKINTVWLYRIASTVGLFVYTTLYIIKTFIVNKFLIGMTLEATTLFIGKSLIVFFLNSLMAVIIAVPLSITLKRALKQNKMLDI
ncbi:MAG: hypothetical protein RUMPE_00601 [Eubacteriales bacterium SKADARSKE-1]|nr:hypothetical protein [Eubacteriales bacterium SKADARSKE-1]